MNQGQNFSFYIKVGKDFAFSMDSEEKDLVNWTQKKVSPFTLRYYLRHQGEFLKCKKSQLQEESNLVSAHAMNVPPESDITQMDGNDTIKDINEREFLNNEYDTRNEYISL